MTDVIENSPVFTSPATASVAENQTSAYTAQALDATTGVVTDPRRTATTTSPSRLPRRREDGAGGHRHGADVIENSPVFTLDATTAGVVQTSAYTAQARTRTATR